MALRALVHLLWGNREGDNKEKTKREREETDDSLGIEMQPRDAEGRVGAPLILPLQAKDTAAD